MISDMNTTQTVKGGTLDSWVYRPGRKTLESKKLMKTIIQRHEPKGSLGELHSLDLIVTKSPAQLRPDEVDEGPGAGHPHERV
jgi:hypothetical protein